MACRLVFISSAQMSNGRWRQPKWDWRKNLFAIDKYNINNNRSALKHYHTLPAMIFNRSHHFLLTSTSNCFDRHICFLDGFPTRFSKALSGAISREISFHYHVVHILVHKTQLYNWKKVFFVATKSPATKRKTRPIYTSCILFRRDFRRIIIWSFYLPSLLTLRI